MISGPLIWQIWNRKPNQDEYECREYPLQDEYECREYPLYSDARIVGELRNLGPFEILNPVRHVPDQTEEHMRARSV